MSAAPQPTPEVDTRPWAIYARLSKATKTGDLEKTEYQVELCRTYAASRGIPTDDELVFIDNSLSAWKKRVKRPRWDALMELATQGRIPGILVYAVDRFTRRPKDLEALIELADDHGMAIEGPRSGRLDLTTATGRQQARWMAMQAASESDNTSERIKTTLGRKMKEGKPMGSGRMFGFKTGGMEQEPEEVAILREVAKRYLAGEPVAHIAADLSARGIKTTRGGDFGNRNLLRTLSRPRYGGYVEHHGELVGRIPAEFGDPVFDADTYDAIQAKVSSQRRGARPTGRYLLTGVLQCGNRKCNGHHMNGATNSRNGTRIYRCPPQLGGCGRSILATGVEEMVDDHMIRLLSRPNTMANVTAREKALTEARDTQVAQVDQIEEALANLEVKLATGEIIPRAYDRAKPVLDRQLAAALTKLDELEKPVVVNPVEASRDWTDLTDAEKRSLISRTRTTITIGPHNPGARRFDPSRVTIKSSGRK